MPRATSLWRPALAVSGLALLAACATEPAQDTYSTPVAPAVAPAATPVAPVTPAIAPTTVAAAPAGRVLTTANGMTVYVYDQDSAGRSTCYDQCAQYWMPVYAPAGSAAGRGLTLIQRSDGSTQWATSNGMPLYTYANDHAPGDEYGNNVDGTWHVVPNYYNGSAYNGAAYTGTTYTGTTSSGTGYAYPSNIRTVSADGAAVTVQPDSNSATVTVVNAGEQVRVLDNDGEWTHVEANGQQGFIRTGALR